MLDKNLIEADASKLDELREIMARQEEPEKLHDIAMKAVLIEHGAVRKLNDSVRSLTAGKKVLMVTGPTVITDNHDRVVKDQVYAQLKADFDVEWLVISEPDSIVHCTPENAAKIQARLEGVDCVVGVGSGTICDLNKYGTFYANPENPVPLIIVQTALSVNAFSDNSSVMLISGVKRTVHSRYPDILIIDLDIVAAAPAEMNVSGYGDLIATWTAPVDWYLGNVLGSEGFQFAADITSLVNGILQVIVHLDARTVNILQHALGETRMHSRADSHDNAFRLRHLPNLTKTANHHVVILAIPLPLLAATA